MGVYFGTTEITNVDWIPGDKDITRGFFATNEIFTVWGEYDGTLPAQYSANGDYLADYRIYGASGGVGDYVAPEYKQAHTDTVTIDGIVWDILGYDHDTVYKSDNTLAQHSVTIQVHGILPDMQYDAKEALFAFDSGLSAGTYHFTVGAQPWYSGDVGKTIQFTLASAIPAGGQLVINNAYNATIVGATISAFASGTATTATETVTMSEGSDGTDIGTVTNGLSQDGVINSIQCAFLGLNKWRESCIRQYLNSAASAGSVWEPKNKWDRPPTWAANTAGFLNGMSAAFKSALGTTSKTTALNNVTDGGGTGTTLDKVFLLSRSEAYAGNEVTGGEGTAYSFYSDFSDLSAPGTGADGNRIKYSNGVAKYWRLRSPNASDACYIRQVSPTGALGYGGPAAEAAGYGVAPACCIPLDDIETNDWLREKFLKNPNTAYSYEIDMSILDGTTSATTPIYIGSDPLGEDEYVDYAAGRIYRVINIFDKESQDIQLGKAIDRNGNLVDDPTAAVSGLIDISGFSDLYIKGVSSGNVIVKYILYTGASSYVWRIIGDENAHVETYGADHICITVLQSCLDTAVISPNSTPQPQDLPVPLPALPTVDGTNIVDYAGQSAAVPSRFVAEYRKEGF